MPKGIKGFQKEELNPMWMGNEVGYSGIHEWIKNSLSKPKSCQNCGKEKRLDLANISQEYKRDIKDWEWLCRKCHMDKDGRKLNMIIRNKQVTRKTVYFSKDPNMIKLFKDIAKKRIRNDKGQFIEK